MVKVYSMTDCPWCEKVKKYLKAKGVAFEEINIEEQPKRRKEIFAYTEEAGVPMTVVGEQFVIGFEREQLDALLAPVLA